MAGGSMIVSGCCAAIAGLVFGAPTWALYAFALVWGVAVVADSAQFSALVAQYTARDHVGTALTVQTCLGFFLTMVTIRLTGVYLVDPIISGIIALCLLPRTWKLVRQAVHILMEGVPPHLDVREIEGAMLGVHGVRAVHDLHVWTLTSGKDAMSAHVLVADRVDREQALLDLQRLLRERFAIEHTTFQFERSTSALLQLSLPPEERSGEAPSGRGEHSRNGESPRDEDG